MANSFSGGFAVGRAERLAIDDRRLQRRLAEKEILKERRDKFNTEFDAFETESNEMVETILSNTEEVIGQLREQGASQEDIDSAKAAAREATLATLMQVASAKLEAAEIARQIEAPEEMIRIKYGDPVRDLTNRMQILDARLGIAGLTPQEQKAPNSVNYWNPQTNEYVAVDVNSTEARQQVQALQRGGYLRVGLDFQSGDEFKLSTSEMEQLTGLEISARNVLAETARLREQLKDQDVRTGLAGNLIIGLQSAADQISQVAEAAGLSDPGLLNSEQYDLSSFGEQAASSAAFRSNIVNLAFVLARAANTDNRISDADVQWQLNRIGQNAGRTTMPIILDEVDRAVKTNLSNTHLVMSRRDPRIAPLAEDLRIDATQKPSTVDQSVSDLADRLQNEPDSFTYEELQAMPEEVFEKAYRELQRRRGATR